MRKKTFTTKDTKSTKFGALMLGTVRVLRDFRRGIRFAHFFLPCDADRIYVCLSMLIVSMIHP